MNLSNLKPAEGSTGKEKRIGRGQGIRTWRNGDAWTQRRSVAFGILFEIRVSKEARCLCRDALPKYGFTNLKRVEYKGINLGVLEELATKNSLKSIDVETLIEAGFISKNDRVKIARQRNAFRSARSYRACIFKIGCGCYRSTAG